MLIYLHGFRSSPQSFKARLLQEYCVANGLQAQFLCPELPVSPREAIEQIQATCMPGPQDTLVGSSLGGFYATYLAEQTGCRAVLVNPAIYPARDLAPYVGPLRTYHDDQPMELLAEHIAELQALNTTKLTLTERYFLIAAKGDEVIDWRDMIARYPGVRTILRDGSDHGLSEFAEHVADVIAFAGMTPPGNGADS